MAVVVGMLAGSTARAEEAGGVTLMREYGLTPVMPPSPAADFRLELLDGGEMALSDAAGDWVLLTFFATWCGPCRGEMPSLERLHRLREERGVTILGVSVDSDTEALATFIGTLGITFPVLLDPDGRVADTYRARSIPLSYLIDPSGRVVGVARGARDWAALTGLLDGALALHPAASPAARGKLGTAAARYATARESLLLPAALEPPSATVELSEPSPRVGEPFQLMVRVRWSGDFQEYLLHPPQLNLPPGVEQRALSAETSTRAERHEVTYRFTLRATEAGRHALDPVELRYTPRAATEPVTSRVAGPVVEARSTALASLAGGPGALLAGGVAAALLALFTVVARRRRCRPRAGVEVAHECLRRWDERFERARRHRLEGDGAACLSALLALRADLGGERDEEAEAALEAARYGAQPPPAQLLDGLEHRVTRRLSALRPDLQAEERRALRWVRGEG